MKQVQWTTTLTNTAKGFGDILHTPDRYTGQVHLDQRFLDRRLSASVTLNDGCFKDLLA